MVRGPLTFITTVKNPDTARSPDTVTGALGLWDIGFPLPIGEWRARQDSNLQLQA